MDGYLLVIIATLIVFFLLAALLLVPVYRFLDREQQASKAWTPEKIAERLQQRRASTDGADPDPPQEETRQDG